MGNGYNHHHHLHQNFYSKSSFMPILCRISIKDLNLKNLKDPSSSSSNFSDEPSSPKVSCIGQVKKNTKIIGFPTPYRLTSSSATSTAITATKRSNSIHGGGAYLKYTKLKRLFSGKNIMPPAPPSNASAASCRSSRGICRNGSRRSSKINHDDGNNQVNVKLNINELDPPLPVVKKVQPAAEMNLWKRRSGGNGITLKSLHIEQIQQLPNNNYRPPAPTV
ncbi:hypothetical protein M9H77_18376 [Catharanthus roseus]|uniref:Uncharacterized protein n=1 Tax=Catharanthus roseus TaxID=4058 RepID=A0ACC0B7A3_CATRO|nr:hypothetical protein M9H77_18376 [Catharanthus roseus]